MLDEAMLRPGRLEVQIEIGLPDEKGRLQILKIHTSRVSAATWQCCWSGLLPDYAGPCLLDLHSVTTMSPRQGEL